MSIENTDNGKGELTGEFFTTNFAGEWLLARMNAFVILKHVFVAETPFTDFTFENLITARYVRTCR